MQRPAMEKVQVTRDHDKRAGEWCIVWGAPPHARTSNAHLQLYIRDVSCPHTADIVFLCVQEIRRHLARSLVSLVGSQWWWWWWPMRRAGQHQGGRRTNLYLYLDFLLYLYFHLYLSIWWWATTHAGRRSLFQQLSIFPSVNPQPALHMTGFVVFFLQDLVFVKYMIECHKMITTILGCTSVRFDIYLGYLCFHGKKNIAIQQPRYSLNLLKDHPELLYHLWDSKANDIFCAIFVNLLFVNLLFANHKQKKE